MRLIENATSEKLRGGFYTPKPIADFILRWAISGSTDSDILEPSCGDGNFISSLRDNNFAYNSLLGIELDPVEAEKAASIGARNSKVLTQDFHTFCINTDKRFDLIVGNPPYIRYQYFDKDQQHAAEEIFAKAGLKYSKLTNAWVSFVVGSSMLLKETGKIGFVLPAEILQVSYGQQLRNFIAHFYNKINIISFEKLVFPNIQQEVVLLLCEKDNTESHKIDHIEVRDADDLINLDPYLLKFPKKRIDFKSNKWTFYFLDQEEIDFLEDVANRFKVPTIGDYAKVEVGITTGSNEFFTVPLSTIEEFHLQAYAKPLVGRSVQVNSVIFNQDDWVVNRNSSARAHLLVFPERSQLNPLNGAAQYIQNGEELGINKGYKCGIRDDWFVVPSLKVPDAFFIRRNNIYPKLIINEAGAYSTDTMHRVFMKPGTDIQAFTASYYNSLSLAFAEVSGRSHGGGVLELMPNETGKILLPYSSSNRELLTEIDNAARQKMPIEELLKVTNRVILQKNYGFTVTDIELANRIWKKLSNRRLNRGKKTKSELR